MKKLALSLASIVVLSGISFAEEGMASVEIVNPFYAGIALGVSSTRGSDADLDFFRSKAGQERMINLTLNAGYDLNKYFAGEVRYTASIAKDDVVEMSGWSLFVKPQYPVDVDIKLYALLGYGGVAVDGVTVSRPVKVDDSGFQWGLGASYSLNNVTDYNIEIYADYTSLANEMDAIYWNGDLKTSADALTAGAAFRF
ncbi:MAG: outer membrane beta-barrel protein [Campylobacterota bacterium]|nr:outer membrane beta-barrel protein [Campylobacterota bacterium]